MESLKISLQNALREEFFPYTTELALQEHLQTNGYFISNVTNAKGVISFKAKNTDKLMDTLLFTITEATKKMSIVSIISQQGRGPFLMRTISVSDLPVNNVKPFFDVIDKASYNSSILSDLNSYIKGYNRGFFTHQDNTTDTLFFSLMSRFKVYNAWIIRKQNLLFENGIFDLLRNIHSIKLPLISELSVIKKRELKNYIIEEIVFSFLRGTEFPQKRLSQLVNQGSSFIGLNIYPMLLNKVKYNKIEFDNLFFEMKDSLHSNIINYLIANIQSLVSDNSEESNSKLKTFHRNVFGKTLRNITAQEKYKDFMVSGFSLHVLMVYLESHPEIISHFFDNCTADSDPINISVNIHKRNSSRVPLCIGDEEYEVLRNLYNINREVNAVPRDIFEEIPF